MKRPRTEFAGASLAALPVAVTLEVHSLRGDALEDGPEQGAQGAPTISVGATITPSDCPQPADPAATLPNPAGRNVVFLLGDSVVDKGGRYAGTAVTRGQDDRVVLVLKDVRPLP